MRTFLENHKLVRAADAAGAAQTDITSAIVPLAGYERVTFIALLGDISAGGSVKMTLFAGDDPTGTLGVEIEDTAVSSAVSDSMLAIEFYRPDGQYVHVVIERDAEDSAIDGVLCVLSDAKELPVGTDDTVADSKSLTYSQL